MNIVTRELIESLSEKESDVGRAVKELMEDHQYAMHLLMRKYGECSKDKYDALDEIATLKEEVRALRVQVLKGGHHESP